MYTPYIIIPLITLVTALLGSWVSIMNMDWYGVQLVPGYTPPGSTIGAVWTVLFILATVAALIVWKPVKKKVADKKYLQWRNDVSYIFLANAGLNVIWSVLFFGFHLPLYAVFEAGLLGVSVAVLMLLIWPKSKIAALLLVPYLLWVAFATQLTYAVWLLNR